MKSIHATPEDAVNRLLAAYKAADFDGIIEERDFDADSRIYFQSLGLPLSEEQRLDAANAFEENFRRQIDEGITDYSDICCSIQKTTYPEPNLAIVSLTCKTPDNEHHVLRIPVLRRPSGWRVILHPDYDQF